MTNDEAKQIIIDRGYIQVKGGRIYDGDKWREAIDVISKMFEGEQKCEDCISRAEAIKAIEEYGSVWMEYTEEMSVHQIAERALKASNQSMYKILHDLPSIQPKPKTGHWKQYGNSWEDKYKCSECGEAQPKILCGEKIIGHWSNYCPNCGAKMVEPQNLKYADVDTMMPAT